MVTQSCQVSSRFSRAGNWGLFSQNVCPQTNCLQVEYKTPPFNQSASAWDPGLTRLHLQLPYGQLCLGHGGNGVVRRAHLGEDFIQPLQGPVKMNLNPAWGACHILSMILCTPTLEHKFIDISCNSPETVCYIKSPTYGSKPVCTSLSVRLIFSYKKSVIQSIFLKDKATLKTLVMSAKKISIVIKVIN